MINTNIKNSHLRIENLFKSIFTEVPHTSISLNDESVIIEHNDQSNPDAASIEIFPKIDFRLSRAPSTTESPKITGGILF